jgi:methylmalonyl-CoA carboxyltransferase large subunit
MGTSTSELISSLDALRSEVKSISERLALLEAHTTRTAGPPANGSLQPKAVEVPKPAPAAAEGISDEVVLILSAAVAAFLGERAHIRQIRLISSRTWAIQGRVSIQASHHLHPRNGK